MKKIFENKVALVTGASFGIGRATAVAFARRGATVVVADWVHDGAGETIKQIKEAGSKSMFIQCNVSKTDAVKAMIEHIIATFGRLDFAFNNAGIEGIMAPLHECTEENWDNTININLKGVWLCMKYELPHMLKQGSGVIVNCASVAGLKAFVNLPAYVASKHAVVGITKTSALEVAPSGVRINAVCPGVIRTPMVERVTGNNKEAEKRYTAMEPVGRMGAPGEIAEAVIWLCSDAASFVTGIAMPVDGGFMA